MIELIFQELFTDGKNGDNKMNYLENRKINQPVVQKNQLNHQENQPTSCTSKIN